MKWKKYALVRESANSFFDRWHITWTYYERLECGSALEVLTCLFLFGTSLDREDVILWRNKSGLPFQARKSAMIKPSRHESCWKSPNKSSWKHFLNFFCFQILFHLAFKHSNALILELSQNVQYTKTPWVDNRNVRWRVASVSNSSPCPSRSIE